MSVRRHAIVSTHLALLCLAACSSSPSAVCEHYIELRDEDGMEAGDAQKSECEKTLSALKDRSSKAWGCASGCIEKADSAKRADECPWSCETQYGNDGESFKGKEAQEVQARWENGILGDGGKAAGKAKFDKAIQSKAAAKARRLEACVKECKPKHKVATPEYKTCMKSCQMKKMLDEAKK